MKSRCDYSPELARPVWIGIREVSVYRLVRCKVIVLGKQQTGCRRRGRDSRALECSFAVLCSGRIMGWRWGAERHMSERIERTSHESTMVPSGFEEMGSIYDMHSGTPTGLYYLQQANTQSHCKRGAHLPAKPTSVSA